MTDEHRPSYEDLARRDAVRETARRQEQEINRGHDDVYIGVILMTGVLGLIMYFFIRM